MSKPKTKTLKVKPGYYDPADYILVHKEHYADLLYRTAARLEVAHRSRVSTGILLRNEQLEAGLRKIRAMQSGPNATWDICVDLLESTCATGKPGEQK